VPPITPGGPNQYNIPGSADAQKITTTPIDHCLVRFVDVTVEPGKSYRYRLKVRMNNPNYSPTPEERKDTYKNFAKPRYLESPPMPVPGIVTIPPDQFVYAVDQMKYETDKDRKKLYYGNPQPSQAVVQVQQWLETWRADPARESTEYEIGEWVVARRVFVERGEYVGRTGAGQYAFRTEVPVKEDNNPKHDLAADPKPPRGYDKYKVPLQVGDTSILIDFDRGQTTYNRPAPPPKDDDPEEKKPRPVAIHDNVATELLIMRPDGTVIARNEAEDAADPARVKHYEAYMKRIKDLRGGDKPDSGGTPADPFGGGGKP